MAQIRRTCWYRISSNVFLKVKSYPPRSTPNIKGSPTNPAHGLLLVLGPLPERSEVAFWMTANSSVAVFAFVNFASILS